MSVNNSNLENILSDESACKLIESSEPIDSITLLMLRGLDQQISGIQMQMRSVIYDYVKTHGWNTDTHNAEFNIETGLVYIKEIEE